MPQTASGGVLLLVVVGIVAFGGFWAVDAAMSEVGTESPYNGTVNQTTEWQSVADVDGDRFTHPTTVTNDSRDLSYEDGEWRWNESDGTIAFSERAENATTGDPVLVDVDGATAVGLPSEQSTVLAIIEPVTRVPGWMLMFIGAGAVLIGLREFSTRNRGGFP